MPSPGLTSRYWCLSARYDALGLRIPMNADEDEIESTAKKANIPTTVVLTGNFKGFALNMV